MTVDTIRFRIWCLNESILHYGDIADRCTDSPEYRAQTLARIAEMEKEKAALLDAWRKLENK